MPEENTTPKKTKATPKESPVKPTTEETKAPEAAPKVAKPSAPSDPTFSVDRLVSEAASFFGAKYPTFVVAGGLSGAKGSLTVKEAKAKIDEWLDTEIKE